MGLQDPGAGPAFVYGCVSGSEWRRVCEQQSGAEGEIALCQAQGRGRRCGGKGREGQGAKQGEEEEERGGRGASHQVHSHFLCWKIGLPLLSATIHSKYATSDFQSRLQRTYIVPTTGVDYLACSASAAAAADVSTARPKGERSDSRRCVVSPSAATPLTGVRNTDDVTSSSGSPPGCVWRGARGGVSGPSCVRVPLREEERRCSSRRCRTITIS